MDPKKLFEETRALLSGMQLSLNIGTLEDVPEPFKSSIVNLKKELDAALLKMAPTDQVPAALDASYSLNYLMSASKRMAEMVEESIKSLNTLREQLSTKTAALNALDSRVTSGDLVEKTAVEKAVADHRKLVAARRSELATNGLPVPMTDDVLVGDDAAWQTRLSTAKQRKDKLSGLALNAAPDRVATLLFGDATAFDIVASSLPPKADPAAAGDGTGNGDAGSGNTKRRLTGL